MSWFGSISTSVIRRNITQLMKNIKVEMYSNILQGDMFCLMQQLELKENWIFHEENNPKHAEIF